MNSRMREIWLFSEMNSNAEGDDFVLPGGVEAWDLGQQDAALPSTMSVPPLIPQPEVRPESDPGLTPV
jgi:hypothetical protein